jgi:hypothetical protein
LLGNLALTIRHMGHLMISAIVKSICFLYFVYLQTKYLIVFAWWYTESKQPHGTHPRGAYVAIKVREARANFEDAQRMAQNV